MCAHHIGGASGQEDGVTRRNTDGRHNTHSLGINRDMNVDRRRRKRNTRRSAPSTLLCALLASSLPNAMAQNCISLEGSIQCPSFNASSISTDDSMVGLFPFLSSVTDTASFDSGLASYIKSDFTRTKYHDLIGCSADISNATDFYARYTTSAICNSIVQNSAKPCSLSGDSARPLCADSCAAYAQSEQEIAASNVCGTSGPDALNQIRADFTTCALPADSLTDSCIVASQNEPNNCGFSSNIGALCSYCAASSPNATDSCCVFSGSSSRCDGVELPIVASSALREPVTVTMTTTATMSTGAASSDSNMNGSRHHKGLTGGQIAGIVVGSVLGALLLLGLILLGCMMLRRRKSHSTTRSVFNSPVASRGQNIGFDDFHDGAHDPMASTGRVTCLSALERPNSTEKDRSAYSATGAYGRWNPDEDDSPESQILGLTTSPPKRGGSLTSSVHLDRLTSDQVEGSPDSNGEYTSPDSHAPSEQLAFFKDYYSQDEIHPTDLVSTLWAYEPRAADEFHLERGDMIKVIGIWDDGWATGIRVRQKADDWRLPEMTQRDSGMSKAESSPPSTSDGDVKAFPLVCVCLPQHWRRTIEGDSTDTSGPPPMP